MDAVRETAVSFGLHISSRELAEKLDDSDDLSHLRQEFYYPKMQDQPNGSSMGAEKECIYLCGNSLGLMPKQTKKIVNDELDKWAKIAVEGHFHGEHPWVFIDEPAVELSAKVVGAKPIEVAVMNSLTANLHFLMVPFYRPTPTRFKILMENKAFPSDHFAAESQIKFHGYNPENALILATQREGENTLRTEDILKLIEDHGDSIALVMLSGVQYYTGQCFDMKAITEAGHNKGCVVGFDLAHAVGNVVLKLHDWNVDFACWCTYKYLNSGPGCIAGAFVHERYAYDRDLPRFAGWWGHDTKTRFAMENNFKQIPGAGGLQVSNPAVLPIVCLIASLKIFDQVGMEKLRQKSVKLTGYLEALLMETFYVKGRSYPPQELASKEQQSQAGQLATIDILTPADPNQRGCQLSLKFAFPIHDVLEHLSMKGVVCDARKPDVIRVAPTPLYNSFLDVWQFVEILQNELNLLSR